MTIFNDEEDYAAEAEDPTIEWKRDDDVIMTGGPQQLHGAVGTVVDTEKPGKWPIAVRLDDKPGFGVVHVAAHEIVPAAP